MLSVDALHVAIESVQVLRGLSLTVAEGTMVGLVGRNGAGKTTLMRSVMGHLPVAQGRIAFDGRDLASVPRQGRAALGIGYMPEDRGLVPSLSVEENILIPVWASRTLQAAERLVAELPGGVRKLLDIAMALTGEPQLLLLDEPTSGVSADEKFPMMEIVMTAVGAQPLTVLFVEHDMDIVERHADRVVAFYSGRIIADDVPQVALAADDVRRYVTGTLAAAPC